MMRGKGRKEGGRGKGDSETDRRRARGMNRTHREDIKGRMDENMGVETTSKDTSDNEIEKLTERKIRRHFR